MRASRARARARARPSPPPHAATATARAAAPLAPPHAAQLLAEIKIHRSLQHRFVVGFDNFFEDRTNVYIMLELCTSQVRPRCRRACPGALRPFARACAKRRCGRRRSHVTEICRAAPHRAAPPSRHLFSLRRR
jgi:hypothetical protein